MMTTDLRIGFLTYCDRPRLTADDQLAAGELETRGANVLAVPWDAPDAIQQLSSCEVSVVRSTWNYTQHHKQYLDWLTELRVAGLRVLNHPTTQQWNTDKIYLRELGEWGHATLPTVWVDRGSTARLSEVLDQLETDRAIVKPRISATARGLFKTSREHLAAGQNQFDLLLRDHDVMVQPFAQEITEHGEWSLIYFGGEYSHAVVKRPRAGDHRVQGDFGGTHTLETPSTALLSQARELLDSYVGRYNEPLLYARVDGIERQGQLVLMELELIEPELFFRADPESPGRFAHALLRTLHR